MDRIRIPPPPPSNTPEPHSPANVAAEVPFISDSMLRHTHPHQRPTKHLKHSYTQPAPSLSSLSPSAPSPNANSFVPSLPHGRSRPRSLSCHPSSQPSRSLSLPASAAHLVDSLDLPMALASLRAYLLGNLWEAEQGLRILEREITSAEVSEDEDWEGTGTGTATEGEEIVVGTGAAGLRRRKRSRLATPSSASDGSVSPSTASFPTSTSTGTGTTTSSSSSEPTSLEAFVSQVSAYIDSIKSDLGELTLPSLSLESTSHRWDEFKRAHMAQFAASIEGTWSFDFDELKTRFGVRPGGAGVGEGQGQGQGQGLAQEAKQFLLVRLEANMKRIHEVAEHLAQGYQARFPGLARSEVGAASSEGGISSRGSVDGEAEEATTTMTPTPRGMMSPRDYLPAPPSLSLFTDLLPEHVAQSLRERYASALPSLPQLPHLPHLPQLPHLTLENIPTPATLRAHIAEDSAKILSDAEKYAWALKEGAKRLLFEHELPEVWKNNHLITSGYRFIPIERWRELAWSTFQWHNETINVWSHLLGSISIIYLLTFIYPSTPLSSPLTSSLVDRIVITSFLLAALKCLTCSATYHLFTGCATRPYFLTFACIDYIGISALITASTVTLTYYGLYCRPEAQAVYIAGSLAVGIAGMVLPCKEWFNKTEFKMFRVAFFLSMAMSAVAPMGHMSYSFGLNETASFFLPVLPSVLAYSAGVIIYANNFPESVCRRGMCDNLGASHQLWHTAIVIAIWLHWTAVKSLHSVGREGFSCAARYNANVGVGTTGMEGAGWWNNWAGPGLMGGEL